MREKRKLLAVLCVALVCLLGIWGVLSVTQESKTGKGGSEEAEEAEEAEIVMLSDFTADEVERIEIRNAEADYVIAASDAWHLFLQDMSATGRIRRRYRLLCGFSPPFLRHGFMSRILRRRSSGLRSRALR